MFTETCGPAEEGRGSLRSPSPIGLFLLEEQTELGRAGTKAAARILEVGIFVSVVELEV